jgi:hypothetical protein
LEPVISSVTLNPDGSYHLAGTLLNGISEGSTYGDDGQMATNFPIVSLTNGPKVYYARTYHWSSTGVMQTGKTVTTEFELPPAIPNGTYSLAVSANGLKSASVPFTVSIVWVDFNNASSGNGTYANPYNTLAAAVNASASGGMIDIKEAGSSSETLTISKSVSILASKGAAMVGIEAPGAREARVSPEEAASSLPPAQRIPAGHPLGPPGRRLNP